jgi:hypothetical protein
VLKLNVQRKYHGSSEFETKAALFHLVNLEEES